MLEILLECNDMQKAHDGESQMAISITKKQVHMFIHPPPPSSPIWIIVHQIYKKRINK